MTTPVNRTAGIHDERSMDFRVVTLRNRLLLAGGKVIDGANSRDSDNTKEFVLQNGLLMGKLTASDKYAPSIVGIAEAYTSGGTTLTVTIAQSVEILRRFGATGTGDIQIVGPPSTGGTNATVSIDHSAIDTSNGEITISDLGVNFAANSIVQPQDSSETILTYVEMISDAGIRVTDEEQDSIDVPMKDVVIGGEVDFSQLLPVSAESSIIAKIKADLNAKSQGFSFEEDY